MFWIESLFCGTHNSHTFGTWFSMKLLLKQYGLFIYYIILLLIVVDLKVKCVISGPLVPLNRISAKWGKHYNIGSTNSISLGETYLIGTLMVKLHTFTFFKFLSNHNYFCVLSELVSHVMCWTVSDCLDSLNLYIPTSSFSSLAWLLA